MLQLLAARGRRAGGDVMICWFECLAALLVGFGCGYLVGMMEGKR